MKELILKYLGKVALTPCYPFESIAVLILDVKVRWGKIKFLVKPTAGKGTAWVTTVKLQGEEEWD